MVSQLVEEVNHFPELKHVDIMVLLPARSVRMLGATHTDGTQRKDLALSVRETVDEMKEGLSKTQIGRLTITVTSLHWSIDRARPTYTETHMLSSDTYRGEIAEEPEELGRPCNLCDWRPIMDE
jgi:hypothetical protein